LREAEIAMISKLMKAQEGRWRRLSGYRLVPLVRDEAMLKKGEWSKVMSRRSPAYQGSVHAI
jgi:hypothetical protein